MAMSPVTPPTEDDEKTLHIVTGSPPPVVADVPEVSHEINQKPQAVVPPMNSDTSPLSSVEIPPQTPQPGETDFAIIIFI